MQSPSSQPVSSEPHSSPLGSTPPPPSKKMIAIVGGVIGALVLVLVGYLVWSRGGAGNIIVEKAGQALLPGAEDNPEATPITHSGLSGRQCAHPDRRTIGVMLAGDPINRPVSGFATADMVFELPVLTNGVTRLTALYQCDEPTDIGSVRSARHDYLFLTEGVDGILAHWGGSYHALNRIAAGEFQTINALSNPFNAFFRKSHLPAPYNGFTTYERLWNAVQKLGYRTTTQFKGYDFKDDAPVSERPAGGTLTVNWPGAFGVRYEYDPTTNRYQRYWGGTKQVDGEDGAPVAPSSVVIMRAVNRLAAGEGGYNEVQVEGEGDLDVYQDGKVIKGRWKKNELDKKDPVHFLNDQGQPMVLTRGQVWLMAVDPQFAVTWTPQ